MKKNIFLITITFLMVFVSCKNNNKTDNDNFRKSKVTTLKDPKGLWKVDTLGEGFIHYQFSDYYEPQKAHQFVNVVELNLDNPKYKLDFVSILDSPDTLSSVAEDENEIVGVNASYELDISFIKTKGHVDNEITLGPEKLRSWKHEGAIFYNSGNDIKIGYGKSNKDYLKSPYKNIYSAAPVLIDSFDLVGRDFVGDLSDVDIDSLEYEDYRRHQGVRHPRTVYALTKEKHLLLITIDGRFPEESEGMTAKEATNFINDYFAPQDALNMDGGGSTTMYIKGKTSNGIVNYPTDNHKRDHYGQRLRDNFLLIRKAKGD